MTPVVRLLLACLAVAPTLSCGSQQDPESSPDAPHLVVLPQGAENHMFAKLSGVLTVNEQDCFALDDRLLVVDHGSRVLADGESIEVPGLGEVRVGDRLSGGGGYIDGADEVDYFLEGHDLNGSEAADCQPEGAAPALAVFTP